MLTSAERETFRNGGRVGVFVRIATDAPLRIWFGVGPCRVGANALDQYGAVYTGFGELLNLPAFQQLINGVAERITLRLSGVSDKVVDLVSENSAKVRGRAVNFGVAVFDRNWMLLGAPRWIFHGVGDLISVKRAGAASPDGQASQAVELSVGTLMTGRKRPRFAYFTPQDQRGRSATDAFCDRVTLYNEREKEWPQY